MMPTHDVLRRTLQVPAFCRVIAVFTTMIWPDTGYARQPQPGAGTPVRITLPLPGDLT